MVSDVVSVALTYIQSVALAIPLVAILLHRLVARWQDAPESTGGFTDALTGRAINALTYSFLVLLGVLVLSVLAVLFRLELPAVLVFASYGIVAAFAMVVGGVVAHFVQFA